MGIFQSSTASPTPSQSLPEKQKLTFVAPTPCSYSHFHPRLHFVNNIACMYYFKRGRSRNRYLLLYSHHGTCDIGQTDAFLQRLHCDLRCADILSYDYEGFGLTCPQKQPSEKGCVRAIDIIFNYACHKLNYSNIILYGVGEGAGPTIDLAFRHLNIHSILLQSPFVPEKDIVPAIRSKKHEAEENNLFSSVFCSIVESIRHIHIPITILHGTKDDVVSFDHSMRLQGANSIYSIVFPIEGGTNFNLETEHYIHILTSLQTSLQTLVQLQQ
jgi:hypothetical protein